MWLNAIIFVLGILSSIVGIVVFASPELNLQTLVRRIEASLPGAEKRELETLLTLPIPEQPSEAVLYPLNPMGGWLLDELGSNADHSIATLESFSDGGYRFVKLPRLIQQILDKGAWPLSDITTLPVNWLSQEPKWDALKHTHRIDGHFLAKDGNGDIPVVFKGKLAPAKWSISALECASYNLCKPLYDRFLIVPPKIASDAAVLTHNDYLVEELKQNVKDFGVLCQYESKAYEEIAIRIGKNLIWSFCGHGGSNAVQTCAMSITLNFDQKNPPKCQEKFAVKQLQDKVQQHSGSKNQTALNLALVFAKMGDTAEAQRILRKVQPTLSADELKAALGIARTFQGITAVSRQQ